jgi:hypothetical protein
MASKEIKVEVPGRSGLNTVSEWRSLMRKEVAEGCSSIGLATGLAALAVSGLLRGHKDVTDLVMAGAMGSVLAYAGYESVRILGRARSLAKSLKQHPR